MDWTALVSAETIQGLGSLAGEWLGFGLGLGLTFWMLGYVVFLIVDIVRKE